MNANIVSRVLKEAEYMIKTDKTIRQLAIEFNVSKSTVHKDLHERLAYINYNIFEQIDSILKNHNDIRHIKGGESTKKKYKKFS